MPDQKSTDHPPYPELAAFFEHLPAHSRVLDVGCGTGRNARHLAKLGCDVIALDNDETALTTWRHDASSAGLSISTVAADMRTVSLNTSFDLILLDRVLHHLDGPAEQQATLLRLANALAPAGILSAVFVSTTDEAFQTFEAFVKLPVKAWRPLLSTPVTHAVPGAGTFVFHALAWQMEPGWPHPGSSSIIQHSFVAGVSI